MSSWMRVLACGCALVGLSMAQTGQDDARAKQAKIQAQVEAELSEKLLNAKRIFVESFGDDSINKSLQAMVIDALRASKRFIITENKAKADLIFKGAALEKTSQEAHALGTSVIAGAAGGRNASVAGDADSQASIEATNDARVSVRLVSPEGDVIWSTTQESKGAKYKGATADVADKVVKQLLWDMEHTSRPQSTNPK
jgi:hypothetical protein